MKKCKDCKYLDLTQKTSVGCVCTNRNRIMRFHAIGNGCRPLNHLKYPTAKACKSGFEPREEEE